MDFHNPFVYWEYLTTNRNGDPVVAAPIQLMSRWEEGQLEIPTDKPGEYVNVDSILATTQVLIMGSIVWEGLISSITGLTVIENLYNVVIQTIANDLKARNIRYEYGLRRYKDTLPKIQT